jgi:cell division septal protein FtsQ
MRSKRKRTTWRPGPLLWLLLIANVTAGLLFSPITSVTRARVDGAKPFDQERIANILSGIQGVPCAQVSPREVESLVLSLPEVRSAELTRNLFGSALLSVRYRRPILRVRNTNNLALTIDGVLYPANELGDDLPLLELPPGEPHVLATIAAPWRPVAVANLAIRAKESWPGEPIIIQVDTRGSVCLNIGTGRVVLGSPTDLDKKLEVLHERLQRNPNELQEVAELNLTAPENPSVVRKKSQAP